jgi:hypothetical protein
MVLLAAKSHFVGSQRLEPPPVPTHRRSSQKDVEKVRVALTSQRCETWNIYNHYTYDHLIKLLAKKTYSKYIWKEKGK